MARRYAFAPRKEMRDDATMLKFTTKESLPQNTYALQLENGIIFYIKMNDWELSVKLDDDETEAKLPEGFGAEELSKAAVHGNAIYFEAGGKIYKVAFTPPGLLRLSYLRDRLEGEHMFRYAMCARTVGISTFVYRLCDYPNRDALVQDLREGEKEGLVAIRIHRKKLIYIMQYQDDNKTLIQQKSATAVVIQIPHSSPYESSFSQDCSPFFYIASKDSLYVINTETLEILPTLRLEAVSFQFIIGVFNGAITLMDNKSKWRLRSAQLPEGYFDVTALTNKIAVQKKGFFDFLFRRNPTPKISDGNNNSNGAENGDTAQSSATLEKMAEPIYLAWKSSVKMSDNIEQQEPCSYSSKDMDRVMEEVCIVAQLNHPGLVRFCGTWTERPPDGFQQKADYYKILKNQGSAAKSLLDFCEDDVFIYIQMTLYNSSLEAWLNYNQAPRDQPRMIGWFKQIVWAVWYLHDNCIIHSDLRKRRESANAGAFCKFRSFQPCNILFDDHGHLKLCGLGIATERKVENGEETISRKPVCSLLYMSPEQSSYPPRYTIKTDVFALGLILTELCVVIKNDEERYEIFDRYREGDYPNHLFEDVETADFVSWLASEYPHRRPTCSEMLAHPFLQSIE